MSRIFQDGMLAGRTALVTGGGTNLGKEAAAELARCGADVVIAGRREDVLAEAAAEIGCRFVAGDIRTEAERIVAEAGEPDLLVNNAGGQYFVAAENISDKGWRAVMRLNVDGTTAMTHAALATGKLRTAIAVTVSPHHGMPGMAHTGAARAAVEELTRQWAVEHPDVVFAAAAIGRFDTTSLRKYPAALTSGIARSVPLGRLGRMEEFGWLVGLLASPVGRALSGTVVTLDGAADNWWGAWPPPAMIQDGSVPTEERRERPVT